VSEQDKNTERDFDCGVSDGFGEDLRSLFEPASSVPAEVDRAILDRAARQLGRRRPIRLLRWAGPVAAVAAVVVFFFALDVRKEPDPAPLKNGLKATRAPLREHYQAVRSSPASMISTADIDGSGRVDILDAFKLARHIKSSARPDKKWDINHDGRVNRADVDAVAFTAVRLDKGVL
jgi:hypothetical protein